MGIQAFVPSGGGGTPGFDYIASVRMETYNRSWSQSGAAGNYILTSNNLSNGYAYFVGPGGTFGTPLGQVINLTGPFTTVNIVAPTGDYISLHKVAVKSTTVFNNALAAFSSFPSVITSSGNFVLPNNALPLVNVMLGGAGGGGGPDGHGGGGGGGGGVVKLTAYQAVGTTAIVIGGGAGSSGKGGDTYFGNVYALGGGGGGAHHYAAPSQGGANGGGGGGYNGSHYGYTSRAGTTQTSSIGLGTKGTPLYHGGHAGGYCTDGSSNNNNRGGGGGGSASAGYNGARSSGGRGGDAHVDTTHGTGTISIGSGGYGNAHHGGHDDYGTHSGSHYGHGGRGAYGDGWGAGGGGNGVVVVRYYIP
jgi:hypothetical protein